jgi:hypothetical protein
MRSVARSALTCGLLACVSLAWCADAYLIRIRNNSPGSVDMEVSKVEAAEPCGAPQTTVTTHLPAGATHDLTCSAADGRAGFCLRPSATSDWIRLDCVDHPLEDVIEIALFGR